MTGDKAGDGGGLVVSSPAGITCGSVCSATARLTIDTLSLASTAWHYDDQGMGTFHVEVTVKNLRSPGRSRRVPLMVDTGATYTTLPRDVLDELGTQPIGARRVVFANGQEEEWPIATILITLDGQEGPTFCLVGPASGPALLGAVTLEEFGVGVDPIAKRLTPGRSYLA